MSRRVATSGRSRRSPPRSGTAARAWREAAPAWRASWTSTPIAIITARCSRIAGRPGELADALLRGARVAVERIDVMPRAGRRPADLGQHPHVGALDVVPVVYLDHSARGAACAEALVVADRIGEELEVPVFLFGELTGADPRFARTRAQLRRGGVAGLAGADGRWRGGAVHAGLRAAVHARARRRSAPRRKAAACGVQPPACAASHGG